MLKAAFNGFYNAVDVCVFILMVGGFLGVVMKTGAIDAGVSNLIARLQGRENRLITILMLFFGLGGTTYGMWEETMAFFPLLLPVFLAAGYDAVVGVAVVLLGAGAGVIASTVNPFATGIAAGFAGVTLGDGLLWRMLQFIVFEGIAFLVLGSAVAGWASTICIVCFRLRRKDKAGPQPLRGWNRRRAAPRRCRHGHAPDTAAHRRFDRVCRHVPHHGLWRDSL